MTNVRFLGSGPLSERFDRATSTAARLHCRQMRKNGDVPYLSHLLRVSGLALDYGAPEDVAIAALLHDAVEDCGGLKTLDAIRAEFGDFVAKIVLETSDSTAENAKEKAPWKERKDEYLKRLRSCSLEAALVSGCDKLDNATSLTRSLKKDGLAIVSQFKGGTKGLVWYYESVERVLKERNLPIAEELNAALKRLRETLRDLERQCSR